jgi:predicted transcriptional regulator
MAARDRVIEALVEGKTREEAAAEAGVTRKTIYNWLKDKTFKRDLAAARHEVFRNAVGRMKQVSDLAANRLVEALDLAEGPATRAKIAMMILRFNAQVTVQEIGEQLEDLEENVANQLAEFRADITAQLAKSTALDASIDNGTAPETQNLDVGQPADDPQPGADAGGNPTNNPALGGPDVGHEGVRPDAGPLAGGNPPHGIQPFQL